MERTNISNLKNRLGDYLRKVRAHETVLALDRNRPVARIERVGEPSGADGPLTRLEAAGLVRRATEALPLKVLAAEEDPGALGVVCQDERLATAAQREGFTMLP